MIAHRVCLWLAAAACCCGAPMLRAQTEAPAQPKTVVYSGATLIRDGAAPLPGVSIVVRGERIHALLAANSPELPVGVEVEDVTGLYVLPGLINAHLHLATPPDRKLALALMRRDVFGGVTAVRSMADDTRAVADLARGARLGEIPGPDIVYTAFFAGPEFFHDPRLISAAQGETAGQVPWMQAITARTDLHEAVTLARGTGAAAIKIYADLDAPLVRRIVKQAHRQGLKAWAHAAVFPASPRDVTDAGADSMSHVCMIAYQGQDMPRAYHDRASVDESRFEHGMPAPVDDVFRRMKNNGTILDATAIVYETIERMRKELPEGQGPPTYCSSALAYRLTARAHDLGVEIAVGTDAPGSPLDEYPSLQREMEILVHEAGMTPIEAIHSATVVSAKALGLQATMGVIEAGKLANLVFVAADPSQDIAALRQVKLVVKRGTRYRRADYVVPKKEEFGEE